LRRGWRLKGGSSASFLQNLGVGLKRLLPGTEPVAEVYQVGELRLSVEQMVSEHTVEIVIDEQRTNGQ
jgi:hypothetical protein